MSARRNATAWCSAIGLPNCTRSRAYSTAYSSAARASPTARRRARSGAVEGAHEPVEALALVAEPAILAERSSSRNISAFTIARWPIFRIGAPKETPASSLSSTNAVMPLRARSRRDGREHDVVARRARRSRSSSSGREGRTRRRSARAVVWHRRSVGARVRLGRREGSERRPFPQSGSIQRRFCSSVAELEDRLGEEAARGDQVADPGAAPGTAPPGRGTA